MKKFCLLAIAALWSVPVHAEAGREVHSVRVGYADLDLRSPHGVAKLQRRLRSAAAAACGTASDADLAGMNALRRCRAETLEAASAQLPSADAGGSAAPVIKLVRNGLNRR